MRVVDSSAWIEWLVSGAASAPLDLHIPSRKDCVMPTIVQLELSKWLMREKSEDEADSFIAYTQKCQLVPLDTAIALLAADLCRAHKLSTADAIIYATALRQGADLLTCDAHFEGLKDVIYVKKASLGAIPPSH